MKLQFAPFFSRPAYDLTGLECLNVYAEPTPYGETWLGRPGLLQRFVCGAGDLGTGPVRGIFRAPGVASDDVLVVCGQGFYVRDEYKGRVAGSGPVQFAASASQVVVTGGGNAYCFTPSDFVLRQITDPDLPQVSGVVCLDGRFYYQELGTDRVWFSDLDDATSIDGLAFESAESRPDALVAMAVRGDSIAFLGQDSYELWAPTGDPNAPIGPIESFRFDKGCAAQASVANLDNAVFFVGADRMVYRCDGGVPARISDFGIEERLTACTDIAATRAYATALDGHLFYVVDIPGQGSFAHDVATARWFQWASWSETGLRISCGTVSAGVSFLGDARTGQVWSFTSGARGDGGGTADGTPIQRMVSAYAPLESGAVRCDVVSIDCLRGTGAIQTAGQVEMRYSGDGGRSWSAWKPRTLGRRGQTTARAIWRRQGLIRPPGRIFQFRTSDLVVFAAHGMSVGDLQP